MKTFHWPVRPGVSKKSEPKVKTIKFGDGYEQRLQNGINNNLHTYSVELKIANSEAIHIDDFLTEHGGVKAFLWQEPSNNRYINVKCGSWSNSVDNFVTTIIATFEEVVA